ncbi:hypothetical protein J4E89_004357 [Alternaria sp. Ai002NY15]|nr:hypothetical protein J4E89_004357 [Alternaria sp. Ai002NY15]
MHGLAHVCTHCSRSFKRAEHLIRHTRTHTREKPYSCRCGQAFTRRDLLTRHWRITHHAGNPDAESTTSTETATTIDAPALNVPSAGAVEAHLVPQVHASQLDLQHPPPTYQELQPAPPYRDEGFEDFRDFVNFIDGVGLSAQWTPEYDFDWMRLGEPRQESRRHSQEPANQPSSPGAEDIGTPFSTWLPSAPADDEVHLRSNAQDGEKRTRNGTYNVTDEHRNFLVSLLESFAPPIADFQIPSRHTLTSSAAQWAALQRDGREDHMPFQQALSILLQGTTNEELVHPIPSPIGNYILLHALLQRIHVVRELSFPATSPATISAAELQVIGRALRAWTSLWQQTPESMLDPNNESGPIPFTSSALLVVAYVRLSLDIGPYRHLESRDTDVIANGLANLPDIERNDNILSALLYSTHALSIPVRLGIDRVARSQAFFWSVQHAISSFECAIFLGKWLCSIPRPFREESLSRSEHRILHWVRCIIKEAYAVIDFEDAEETDGFLTVPSEPFALGLAVLNIWSRFFRGNTQWQFVVNLGLSLEKYIAKLA